MYAGEAEHYSAAVALCAFGNNANSTMLSPTLTAHGYRLRNTSIDKSSNRVGPAGGCFAGRPNGGLGRTAADGEMG